MARRSVSLNPAIYGCFHDLFGGFLIIKPRLPFIVVVVVGGGDQCVVVARIPLPVFKEEMGVLYAMFIFLGW